MILEEFKNRAWLCIKGILPGTAKTASWIVKLTVTFSFAIMLLKYFNILAVISDVMSPLFIHLGLPGGAALAYVTGYFVNCYSAIAVAVSLGLDPRAMTILMTMVLCSHNMAVETAVQKMTGSSAIRVVLTRTFSAIVLGLVLNRVMPGASMNAATAAEGVGMAAGVISWSTFLPAFTGWLVSALLLAVKVTVVIFALNILQALFKEFGVLKSVAKLLSPLMYIFGLPVRCAFLWLIANVVGLAYGAAAMMEEVHSGTMSRRDIDLTNAHIGISHSNLEDLTIMSAVGGIWWVMLLARWGMSILLVWGYRLEKKILTF